MIRRNGVIYQRRNTQSKLKHKTRGRIKALNRNSGVGQAPEFLFKTLKRSRFFSGRFLSSAGTALIIFSILGFLFTYGPIIQVEVGYRLSQIFEKNQTKPPRGSFGDLLNRAVMGEIEGVPDPNFSLIIPKIHAKSKIIPNVDPADEKAYLTALKEGIAHAKGTVFPGTAGNIYLFAHSTDTPINILRYNAVFYLLRELEPQDEVQVYFGGVKHRYIVTNKLIIEPTDVSYLSPYNAQGRERLILQTCWPPGTTLKRLLVFAEKLQL